MAAGNGVRIYRTKMGAALTAANLSIDPMVIIQALITLFTNCFKPTPASVKRQSRRTGLVAVRLLNEVPALDEETAFKVADINATAVNAMSTADVQAMIDDATAGNDHTFAAEPDPAPAG